jgi:hypothetical protein
MNINANYEIIPLAGTMNLVALGYNSVSGSCVHQIYCIAPGSITIGALGGGQATFTMTANQSVDVLAGTVTVGSGTFIGFKSKSNNSYLNPTAR